MRINMTTSEIISALRDMSVDNMGVGEGVAVSRAVWEYNTLSKDSTESRELAEEIVKKAEQMKDKKPVVSGCEYPSALILLFSAYNITGDESYKNVITELEKSDDYMGLAFDMNYETIFGGKEHYHALTVRFAELKKQDRMDDMTKALFMLALADTIAAIAEPVYELYRSLVDIFRDELTGLVASAWQREGRIPSGVGAESVAIFADGQAQSIMSLALKKACALKVVLAEKYSRYITD